MNVQNIYHIPYPAQSAVSDASFLAVFTKDAVGQVAVYVGIVSLSMQGIPQAVYDTRRNNAAQWVAHSGQKLSYRDALAYFPHIEESEYRR